jgi:hypothetical protein
MNKNSEMPRRRRFIVVSVFISVFQILSAIRVLQIPDELAVQVSLALPLEFVMGALWGLTFALASVLLVQNRRYALRYTLWLIVGFVLYSTTRLLVFTRADYDRQRLPFLLAVTLVIVLILTIFLARSNSAQARETTQDGSKPQD